MVKKKIMEKGGRAEEGERVTRMKENVVWNTERGTAGKAQEVFNTSNLKKGCGLAGIARRGWKGDELK